MGARSGMTHRVSILRDEQEETTAWNQMGDPDWQAAYEDVACRAYYAPGREITDGAKNANVDRVVVLFPPGTDILPTDRLGDITDRLGKILYPGPHRVESVGRRADHVHVETEVV